MMKKTLADEQILKQVDALQFYRHCLDPIQVRVRERNTFERCSCRIE